MSHLSFDPLKIPLIVTPHREVDWVGKNAIIGPICIKTVCIKARRETTDWEGGSGGGTGVACSPTMTEVPGLIPGKGWNFYSLHSKFFHSATPTLDVKAFLLSSLSSPTFSIFSFSVKFASLTPSSFLPYVSKVNKWSFCLCSLLSSLSWNKAGALRFHWRKDID